MQDVDYDYLFWTEKHSHLKYRQWVDEHGPVENLDLENLYRVIHYNDMKVPAKHTCSGVLFSKELQNVRAPDIISPNNNIPLSIVVTTRNDTHVERMEERTQAFIDGIYYLAEEVKRNIELIIVEWNPPEQRASMEKGYNYPQNHPYVSTIILTVEKETHDQYIYSQYMPLLQMVAKNVGIRRARGKFILATNIDILLSRELFEYITGPSLESGKMYRSNRWDVDRNILDCKDVAEMIETARDKCLQVNYNGGVRAPFTEIQNDEIEPMLKVFSFTWPNIHTWACGDFQLLHRDDWANLRGYSELDTYSLHLDSVFAVTAYYADLEEIVLDDRYPHFHIDHTIGQAAGGGKYVVKNVTHKHVSMQQLIQMARAMSEYGYFIYNRENWGLSGMKLPSLNVSKAQWDDVTLNYKIYGDTGLGQVDSFDNFNFGIFRDESWLEKSFMAIVDYIEKYTNNKRLLIWGAGKRGRDIGEILEGRGVKIDGFVHGNGAKEIQNEGISKPVYHPENVKFSEAKGADFVMVASCFGAEISAELDESGAIEGKDYIVLM